MDGAITRDGGHLAMPRFDIATQVECEICGSRDVSVVDADDASVMFEFVRDGATADTKEVSTSTVVVSCAECGTTYELLV